MSLEENKAIVRIFVEAVFGKRNWDLLAPDYVDPVYTQLPDLAFFKQLGPVEYTETGKKLFPEDAKQLP